MPPSSPRRFTLLALVAIVMSGVAARSQQTQNPKLSELPNPYRLVKGWAKLPSSMNGGVWGETIRVDVAPDGNIWVFHRCFNTVPPAHATCVNRGPSNPPILEFDPSGKLLKSFGVGLFAYPHGFTIAPDGYVWTTDVNDSAVILGMSAKNAAGVVMGHEVLKLDPKTGKVLMTLGKMGVAGNGPDTFDRPPAVAVAPNGDIFVTDGHDPTDPIQVARRKQLQTGRVVKFSKDGKFIKAWGHLGSEPGNFNAPHDINIGGSQGWVYVADRGNSRIQVFDQDGKFIAAWPQFGRVNSVFVGKDDTIYVGTEFREPSAKNGALRGIMIGNAKDGSLKAWIPDPVFDDLEKSQVPGSSASGIAADDMGNVYAADVGTHGLRKYVKVN
jgi:DNA-binding beta-propeller fold protein YncE